MIRVRYRDSNELSPGLHAAAERHGRTTTVYLLPGLTKPERRSALRRLRLSARMGHCPRLPAWQLAVALFADRIRTGIGRAGAVLRLHPAGSTLPVMVLSGGAIAFLLFSTVSIRVLHNPPTTPEAASSPGPVASAGAVPFAGSQGGVTGLGGPGSRSAIPPGLGSSSLATGPSLAGGTGGQGVGAAPGSGSSGGDTGQGGSGTRSTGGGTTSSGTTLSGGADPTSGSSQGGGSGSGSAGSGSSSSTSPSQAPASSSSSSGTQPAPSATQPASSGLCVKVGPLGVCLNV